KMKYFEQAKSIWKNDVPKSGQSETVQGELLRAVEKLRDEAQRNGNGNWDKGFEILLDYLRLKLLDKAVFESNARGEIKLALKTVSDFEHPYVNDDIYDYLVDRVVEYFQHYGSQQHVRNIELWR